MKFQDLSTRDSQFQLLEELVNQNSFSKNLQGVEAVQNILQRELKALDFNTRLHPLEKHAPILTAASKAYQPDKPYIVVLGHADTVHKPDSNFTELSEKDGKWFGPGAFDMKAGLLMALIAFQNLHKTDQLHKIPLLFVNNSAEEIGSTEARAKLAELTTDASCGLVLEFARPDGGIVLERAGFLAYRVKIEGVAAHSGNSRSEGASAITELGEIIKLVNALTDFEKGTLSNVGVVNGGISNNIMAPRAEMTFEVRLTNNDEVERVRSVLKELPAPHDPRIKVTLEEYGALGPMTQLPDTDKLRKLYFDAAQAEGNPLSIFPPVYGISDGNVLTQNNVPTLDAIGPLGAGAHTDNEFVNPDSIQVRAEILSRFLATTPLPLT